MLFKIEIPISPLEKRKNKTFFVISLAIHRHTLPPKISA